MILFKRKEVNFESDNQVGAMYFMSTINWSWILMACDDPSLFGEE